jgi:hypothetical protein
MGKLLTADGTALCFHCVYICHNSQIGTLKRMVLLCVNYINKISGKKAIINITKDLKENTNITRKKMESAFK